MDVGVFTGQLNLLLENDSIDGWTGGVCEILRNHLSANIRLTDERGGIIAERLLPEAEGMAHETRRMTSPVYAQNTQIGRLIVYRDGEDFSEREQLAITISLTVCTVILRYAKEHNRMEQRRRAEAVKAVLNTLSFSELEASVQVFKELDGSEGLLVAGRIADRLGMTRSVIVNALRKLEGAGMIETRSLGMKGTYIRVHDPLLTSEIKKLERI